MGNRNESIMYLVDCTIKEGKKDDLIALIKQMVTSTEKESGALTYHWSINENRVHIIEQYANSEETLKHLNGFMANFAEDFMAAVDVDNCTVYGNPSEAVIDILDGFGSTYMSNLDGFVR